MPIASESRTIESYVAELRHIAVLLRGIDSSNAYRISVYADRLDNLARELQEYAEAKRKS